MPSFAASDACRCWRVQLRHGRAVSHIGKNYSESELAKRLRDPATQRPRAHMRDGSEEQRDRCDRISPLIVMLVLGSRVHGVRESLWKFLAFVAACIVVLALLLAILAR